MGTGICIQHMVSFAVNVDSMVACHNTVTGDMARCRRLPSVRLVVAAACDKVRVVGNTVHSIDPGSKEDHTAAASMDAARDNVVVGGILRVPALRLHSSP